ncbi:MAG: glycosyltransferase family 4 protein [Candidatus Falkowbacteria bacterium]
MKILLVNKYYYLKGGTERHLFALETLLKEQGHSVVPFAMAHPHNRPSEYSPYFAAAVDFDRFSVKSAIKFFYNYNAVKQLKKLIKAERPDVAHIHNIAHQLTPAIIKVLKKNNIPVVQTWHDYQHLCPNYQLFTKGQQCERCRQGSYFKACRYRCVKNSFWKSLMSAMEMTWYAKIKRAYQQADAYISPSKFMVDVSQRFGFIGNQHHVENFLTETEWQSYRQIPAIAENGYLLYYGRLSTEKGIILLLEAYAKSNIKRPLHLVGSGPIETEVRQTIERLGLSNQVFWQPHVDQAGVLEALAGAAVVILPSLWPENLPYGAIEALAAGRPLLAAATGGLPELVTEHKNGWLFPVGDGAVLAQKLVAVDLCDHASMSDACRASVERMQSHNYAAKIEQVYQSLING